MEQDWIGAAVSHTYTRSELSHLIAARKGAPEGAGPDAMMEFRFRISPEMLEALLGAEIVHRDGRHVILSAVVVNDDGFVEPLLTVYEPAR